MREDLPSVASYIHLGTETPRKVGAGVISDWKVPMILHFYMALKSGQTDDKRSMIHVHMRKEVWVAGKRMSSSKVWQAWGWKMEIDTKCGRRVSIG